jgi:phosphoglycerol transferase MdoB-like AlkP superfamily enzyme
LGKFMARVKKQSWYKNTIFILVADHGHSTPVQSSPSLCDFYKIPLLIYGEPLKKDWRGKRCSTIGSQNDFAATLLYQMGLSSKSYPWSRNLLTDQAKNFAFHTTIRGYGWVSKEGQLSYHFDYKEFLEKSFVDSSQLKIKHQEAQYYFRSIYEYYKNL